MATILHSDKMGEVKILEIGTQTNFGAVEAIVLTGGERYYMLIDKYKTVSLMPWFAVKEVRNQKV